MKYGKLVNGRLVPAPNPLQVGNGEVWNPSEYLWEIVGYRRIVDTPRPEGMESGCSAHWEERDGQIVKVWTPL